MADSTQARSMVVDLNIATTRKLWGGRRKVSAIHVNVNTGGTVQNIKLARGASGPAFYACTVPTTGFIDTFNESFYPGNAELDEPEFTSTVAFAAGSLMVIHFAD